jgi:hypothetical protein
MPVLPVLSPKQAVKAFGRFGWEVARGTLRTLMSRAGISVEEFLNALKQ